MRDDVRKTHFPTGRIAFEDVLRLVITQFGMIPLRNLGRHSRLNSDSL
jgi:hypothetical protein